MTKSELVKQISYSTGIDYATALTVVEAFMSEVNLHWQIRNLSI